MNCPNCEREIPADAKSCPSCATSLSDSFSPTQLLDANKPRKNKTDSSSKRTRSYSSFDSIDDARFVPGEVLADRYRIVGLLGRGGMGEVYRADDLKLGQPVALKFLPDHLLSDGAALARFHREVRVARQVSHKNVCRVYDIGEIDCRHFLSMEFIKGEELSSLLRRIGRLPADKAVQLARQICAGLAAAHDVGFLHRDLKPTTNLGAHLFIGKFMSQMNASIFLPFISLFLLLLFMSVLRRERLAFALLWLLLGTVNVLIGQVHVLMIPFAALSAFLATFVLYRFGLLASVAALFFAHLWVFYPMTTELSAWYATDFLIGLSIGVALVVFGFYTSLAGQPLFGGKLLQD